MATLVLSGKSLHQVFNNLNNIDIATEINDLEERIRSINLESAGIHNVSIFKELIETLSTIKKELMTSRISLKSFAKSTISRATSLEHAINVIEEKPTKIRFGLKLAANQMLNIIKLHDETIPEAENHMAEVKYLLKSVDELLPRLKETIETHNTAQTHYRQRKQINSGHLRRKRSDSLDSAGDIQKKVKHDVVISLFQSVFGKETVNMAGGVIDSIRENGDDVPMINQFSDRMDDGILGAVVDAGKDSKGNELTSKLTKYVLGLLGTASEHRGRGIEKISYKTINAALTQVIGVGTAASKLADHLTNTNNKQIKKIMDEAKQELLKAEAQLQKYNSRGRSLDGHYQKLMQDTEDKRMELKRQENLFQQILFQDQQNTLQSAMSTMEFMHNKFSETAIQLRSKIIPFEEAKSKLAQLIKVLSLRDPAGQALELNPNDKARAVNMIHNVKNACNNFLYKRITQDYKNFE